MISVIMPTLWKGEHYKRMLPELDRHDMIGEIIVIDNDTTKTDSEIFNLKKLSYYPQEQNIYVNPAWNFGVSIAKYDRICLYSDDVYFDPSAIDAIYPHLIESNGVAGFSFDSISENDSVYRAEWEVPKVTPTSSFHYRFGICMFMHKASYHPIPIEYKIYYGDTYLFDNNLLNGKQNYAIENYTCITKMKTSSKYFNEIGEEDHRTYKQNNPSEGLVIDFMDDVEGYLESLNR